MTRKYLCAVAAMAVTISAGAAFGESVWVKSESVEVRSGKGAVYPTVSTVKKGQELTVVGRDGKWIQVQAGTATGWVYEGSLSAQKVDGGGGFNIAPGSTAEMGTAAAGRGLNPSAETYVADKHLDKRPLEGLIALRKTITPAEWDKFTSTGHIGPSAGQ